MIGDPVWLLVDATVDIAAEPGAGCVISFGRGVRRVCKTNWPNISEYNGGIYRHNELTTIPVGTQQTECNDGLIDENWIFCASTDERGKGVNTWRCDQCLYCAFPFLLSRLIFFCVPLFDRGITRPK